MEPSYEPKSWRIVIENWLWNPDPHERISAGVEIRRRMVKVFPEPDWVKQRKAQRTGEEVV